MSVDRNVGRCLHRISAPGLDRGMRLLDEACAGREA